MRWLASSRRALSPEVGFMSEQAYRLGDLIDDYCPRCRLLLNHAVASMVDGKVVKVVCQTCHNEHAYRHGQGGKEKKKKASPRATLFDQVLAGATTATNPPSVPSESKPGKKKKTGTPARYISRHKTPPPRSRR